MGMGGGMNPMMQGGMGMGGMNPAMMYPGHGSMGEAQAAPVSVVPDSRPSHLRLG
jgi:hypothetical protein